MGASGADGSFTLQMPRLGESLQADCERMYDCIYLAGLEFEWDASKATSNLKKHRISFEDAVRVFEHPVLEIRTDHGGEERYKAIGLAGGSRDRGGLHGEERSLPYHLSTEGKEE